MSQANAKNEIVQQNLSNNESVIEKPKRQYKRKPKENLTETEEKKEEPSILNDSSQNTKMSESTLENSVENFNQDFWKPSFEIVECVLNILVKQSPDVKHILEMTHYPESDVFMKDSHKLNWCTSTPESILSGTDCMFVRHALERVQKPQEFLEQMKKNVRKGYIETTSIFSEMTNEIYRGAHYRGHLLSKYIIWVSQPDNRLHILPKSPIIDYIQVDKEFENDIRTALKAIPYYWNSYYMWDENKPLEWTYYQHGVNFDANKDYPDILQIALEQSMKSIREFLKYINEKNNI